MFGLLYFSLLALITATGLQATSQTVVEVSADRLYQPTGVSVTKGEVYELTAEGHWQDADFPSTDGNGFKGFTAPMFFGMLLKPMPGQYYMKLCGKVGNWKFPIGTSITIRIRKSGELLLFPNDAKGFYKNNHGILRVAIKRKE